MECCSVCLNAGMIHARCAQTLQPSVLQSLACCFARRRVLSLFSLQSAGGGRSSAAAAHICIAAPRC